MKKEKKSKAGIIDETLRENPQYRFYRDEILKDYVLDTMYDTGEITAFRGRKRTIRAVRRLIKFGYDVENSQPIIFEYFVDALTKSSTYKSYNSIDAITKAIELESSKIKSIENAYEKYIPMDNFMMKTSELFKNKVDEVVEKGYVLGYRIMNLNWKIVTVLNHQMNLDTKLLEDHIVIHTPFSSKFFWDNIDISIEDTEPDTFFLKPIWDEELGIWKEGATPEEINQEFKKYFK